jgi:poly(ADP-ribose) glycohydrolase ARH3
MTLNTEMLRSKFVGSMIGCGIGDALGTIAFHRLPKLLIELKDVEVLSYTDDTAMAIGLAESIAVKKCVDERHLGDRFKHNYLREPNRGYASGPPKVFNLVDSKGMSYSKAAQMLYGWQGSLGNGGAMRAGPVGLFFYDSENLYEQAKASSIVTHAHPVGIDGAAIIARLVAEAVRTEPGPNFDPLRVCARAVQEARTMEFQKKMKLVGQLLEKGVDSKEAADELDRGFRADESVPFAVYSFLRNPSSFVDCLVCAVGNGGDRDTLGAMAGSISGAYLGVDAIPENWKNKLENREYIEKLGMLLLQTKLQNC